jgi:hypothetical protein
MDLPLAFHFLFFTDEMADWDADCIRCGCGDAVSFFSTQPTQERISSSLAIRQWLSIISRLAANNTGQFTD